MGILLKFPKLELDAEDEVEVVNVVSFVSFKGWRIALDWII